jgi:hypothetical protein
MLDKSFREELIKLSNHKKHKISRIENLIQECVDQKLKEFHKDIMNVLLDALQNDKSIDAVIVVVNNLKK